MTGGGWGQMAGCSSVDSVGLPFVDWTAEGGSIMVHVHWVKLLEIGIFIRVE